MGLPLEPAMFPAIAGPDFIRSDEVAELAAQLLSRHGGAGGIGRLYEVARAVRDGQLRILYMLNGKPMDAGENEFAHDVVGKCIKAPTLWRDVTGYDVVIWVRHYHWDRYDLRKRSHVVLHELMHVEAERDEDDEVRVKVRKHDAEVFLDAIRHYGPLDGATQSVATAIELWEADGGTPDPNRDTSATTIEIRHADRVVTLDASTRDRIDARLRQGKRRPGDSDREAFDEVEAAAAADVDPDGAPGADE